MPFAFSPLLQTTRADFPRSPSPARKMSAPQCHSCGPALTGASGGCGKTAVAGGPRHRCRGLCTASLGRPSSGSGRFFPQLRCDRENLCASALSQEFIHDLRLDCVARRRRGHVKLRLTCQLIRAMWSRAARTAATSWRLFLGCPRVAFDVFRHHCSRCW